MANTILGNVLDLFQRIGIYDIVLPFLLVFTLMFAILDRTKILGVEKIGGEEFTKKNLNAMLAFTIAFLVIASSRLVETIIKVSSEIVVVAMLVVFFLLLIGTFYKEGELLKEGYNETGKGVIFVGIGITIIFIFLNAITDVNGKTWLRIFLDYVDRFWTSTAVASVILIVGIVLFVYFLMREPVPKKSKGDS
jgi:hypothetical protein